MLGKHAHLSTPLCKRGGQARLLPVQNSHSTSSVSLAKPTLPTSKTSLPCLAPLPTQESNAARARLPTALSSVVDISDAWERDSETTQVPSGSVLSQIVTLPALPPDTSSVCAWKWKTRLVRAAPAGSGMHTVQSLFS